jgi:hypothetical protein
VCDLCYTRKLLGVVSQVNRFVANGDARSGHTRARSTCDPIRNPAYAIVVGLELKEPSTDHTGVYVGLLAIQAVSVTAQVATAAQDERDARAAFEQCGPFHPGVRTA